MNIIKAIFNFFQSIRRNQLKQEEAELLGFIARLEKEIDPNNVDDDVTIDKMNVLNDLKQKLQLVQNQLSKIG